MSYALATSNAAAIVEAAARLSRIVPAATRNKPYANVVPVSGIVELAGRLSDAANRIAAGSNMPVPVWMAERIAELEAAATRTVETPTGRGAATVAEIVALAAAIVEALEAVEDAAGDDSPDGYTGDAIGETPAGDMAAVSAALSAQACMRQAWADDAANALAAIASGPAAGTGLEALAPEAVRDAVIALTFAAIADGVGVSVTDAITDAVNRNNGDAIRTAMPSLMVAGYCHGGRFAWAVEALAAALESAGIVPADETPDATPAEREAAAVEALESFAASRFPGIVEAAGDGFEWQPDALAAAVASPAGDAIGDAAAVAGCCHAATLAAWGRVVHTVEAVAEAPDAGNVAEAVEAMGRELETLRDAIADMAALSSEMGDETPAAVMAWAVGRLEELEAYEREAGDTLAAIGEALGDSYGSWDGMAETVRELAAAWDEMADAAGLRMSDDYGRGSVVMAERLQSFGRIGEAVDVATGSVSDWQPWAADDTDGVETVAIAAVEAVDAIGRQLAASRLLPSDGDAEAIATSAVEAVAAVARIRLALSGSRYTPSPAYGIDGVVMAAVSAIGDAIVATIPGPDTEAITAAIRFNNEPILEAIARAANWPVSDIGTYDSITEAAQRIDAAGAVYAAVARLTGETFVSWPDANAAAVEAVEALGEIVRVALPGLGSGDPAEIVAGVETLSNYWHDAGEAFRVMGDAVGTEPTPAAVAATVEMLAANETALHAAMGEIGDAISRVYGIGDMYSGPVDAAAVAAATVETLAAYETVSDERANAAAIVAAAGLDVAGVTGTAGDALEAVEVATALAAIDRALGSVVEAGNVGISRVYTPESCGEMAADMANVWAALNAANPAITATVAETVPAVLEAAAAWETVRAAWAASGDNYVDGWGTREAVASVVRAVRDQREALAALGDMAIDAGDGAASGIRFLSGHRDAVHAIAGMIPGFGWPFDPAVMADYDPAEIVEAVRNATGSRASGNAGTFVSVPTPEALGMAATFGTETGLEIVAAVAANWEAWAAAANAIAHNAGNAAAVRAAIDSAIETVDMMTSGRVRGMTLEASEALGRGRVEAVETVRAAWAVELARATASRAVVESEAAGVAIGSRAAGYGDVQKRVNRTAATLGDAARNLLADTLEDMATAAVANGRDAVDAAHAAHYATAETLRRAAII